jgi:hypothetical protein
MDNLGATPGQHVPKTSNKGAPGAGGVLCAAYCGVEVELPDCTARLIGRIDRPCALATRGKAAADRDEKKLVGAVHDILEGHCSRKHGPRFTQKLVAARQVRQMHRDQHFGSAIMRPPEHIL